MWSETVGFRTRPVSDQQKSVLVLALVLQVWCCVVKHGLVTLVVIMILKDSNFSSTIYSSSILCLEHHYCADHQRRLLNLNQPSAFVYSFSLAMKW